jgi:ATP adenylyltransferase
MRQLWAPWRMAYIKDDKDKSEPQAECIFCAKAAENRDDENLIVVRGALCFAMLNLFPYNNGHLLIAPYQHLPSISDLEPDALTEIMVTAQRCLGALKLAMGPQGYNMGINQGAAAGAGIADHVHFHLVPRWIGDTNFMPVLADVKVMPEYLQTTLRQIRENLGQNSH